MRLTGNGPIAWPMNETPYSEENFCRMENDPDLTRAYFWKAGQRMLLLSVEKREAGQLADAQWYGAVGRAVLDHIDALVESCVRQ